MTEVLPFKGLRYNLEKSGEITTLVAPPYDVVDKSGRDSIVARNPKNVFSLELPEPCGQSDGYTASKRLLDSFVAGHVLEEESSPTFYPYEIDFQVEAKVYRRKGLVGAVRLEDWENRGVRPHEQTFDKVTEDRLRLLEATQTQFSPIFLLYRSNADVGKILQEAAATQLYTVEDGQGSTHRFSMINDHDVVRALSRAFQGTVLYIADGHHRYTTALNYRNLMRRRHPSDRPMRYDYVMAYLVDVDDPGLVVLPTHRILSIGSGDLEHGMSRAGEYFSIRQVNAPKDPEALSRLMSAEIRQTAGRSLGLVIRNEDGFRAALLTLSEAGKKELDHLPPQLARLDVVMFEELLVKRALGLDPHLLEERMSIRYSAHGQEAIGTLGGEESLFFMAPTPAHQALDVSDAGLTMPHKSTFFYPKILTGLVMNPVGPQEMDRA